MLRFFDKPNLGAPTHYTEDPNLCLELDCNLLGLRGNLWGSLAMHVSVGVVQMSCMTGSSLSIYHPTACALFAGQKSERLEGFEKHDGSFVDDELQGRDSSARAQKVISFYSTTLFAPMHQRGPL
jgi:hypothetical protein